jgi:hypothetical protein
LYAKDASSILCGVKFDFLEYKRQKLQTGETNQYPGKINKKKQKTSINQYPGKINKKKQKTSIRGYVFIYIYIKRGDT